MKHVIEMVKEKDCKGSVKYSSADPDAVVSNIYLSRKAAQEMPPAIKVTVEA